MVLDPRTELGVVDVVVLAADHDLGSEETRQGAGALGAVQLAAENRRAVDEILQRG